MKSKLLKINKSKRAHELKVEAVSLERSWVSKVINNVKKQERKSVEVVTEKVSSNQNNYYVYSDDETLRTIKLALHVDVVDYILYQHAFYY